MRAFLSYWRKCAGIAAKGSTAFANDWQWLFGIPVVSVLLQYFAVQQEKTTLSTGYPILDGVLVALAAFIVTWGVAFSVRLLNAPVGLDKQQRDEIDRLRQPAQSPRATSFDVFIEEIPPNDADRRSLSVEHLFRAGIKDLEHDRTFEAYAVLESSPPELGISPAAKLPAMGKGIDARTFPIAPTETAYVLLLEQDAENNPFLEGQPHIRFSADSSDDSGMLRAASSLLRRDKETGKLQAGHTYRATLAVHAAGAVSRRLPFEVTVEEHSLSVKADR